MSVSSGCPKLPVLPVDLWHKIVCCMWEDECCIYTHADFMEHMVAISDVVSGVSSRVVDDRKNDINENKRNERIARINERKAANGDCKQWHVNKLVLHSGLTDLRETDSWDLVHKICSLVVRSNWKWLRTHKDGIFGEWEKLLDADQITKIRILANFVSETIVDPYNVDPAMMTDRFVANAHCSVDALRFVVAHDVPTQAHMLNQLFPTIPDIAKARKTLMEGSVWARASRASRALVLPPVTNSAVKELLERFVFDSDRTQEEEGDAWSALELGVRGLWTERMRNEGIPNAFQLFLLQEKLPRMSACVDGMRLFLERDMLPSLYMCGLHTVSVVNMQDVYGRVLVSELPEKWTMNTKWGNASDLSDVTRSMVDKARRCLRAYKLLRDKLVQFGLTGGVRETSYLCRTFVMSGGKGGPSNAERVAGIMHAYDWITTHTSYASYMQDFHRNKHLCMTLAIHDCHMNGVLVPRTVMRVWKRSRSRYATSQKKHGPR